MNKNLFSREIETKTSLHASTQHSPKTKGENLEEIKIQREEKKISQEDLEKNEKEIDAEIEKELRNTTGLNVKHESNKPGFEYEESISAPDPDLIQSGLYLKTQSKYMPLDTEEEAFFNQNSHPLHDSDNMKTITSQNSIPHNLTLLPARIKQNQMDLEQKIDHYSRSLNLEEVTDPYLQYDFPSSPSLSQDKIDLSLSGTNHTYSLQSTHPNANVLFEMQNRLQTLDTGKQKEMEGVLHEIHEMTESEITQQEARERMNESKELSLQMGRSHSLSDYLEKVKEKNKNGIKESLIPTQIEVINPIFTLTHDKFMNSSSEVTYEEPVKRNFDSTHITPFQSIPASALSKKTETIRGCLERVTRLTTELDKKITQSANNRNSRITSLNSSVYFQAESRFQLTNKSRIKPFHKKQLSDCPQSYVSYSGKPQAFQL